MEEECITLKSALERELAEEQIGLQECLDGLDRDRVALRAVDTANTDLD